MSSAKAWLDGLDQSEDASTATLTTGFPTPSTATPTPFSEQPDNSSATLQPRSTRAWLGIYAEETRGKTTTGPVARRWRRYHEAAVTADAEVDEARNGSPRDPHAGELSEAKEALKEENRAAPRNGSGESNSGRGDLLELLVDFVRQQGGSVNSNKLGRLYSSHPELRSIFTEAGGPKKFCEAHSCGELKFIAGFITLTTTCTDEDALRLIIDFAQERRGSFSSDKLKYLYQNHREVSSALSRAGGLQQFCAKHEGLSFENGICRVTGETAVGGSGFLPESCSVVEALPSIQPPERLADIIRRIEKAVSVIAGAVVHAFGSAVNGFGDETSDVDLVLEASIDQLKYGLELNNVSKRDIVPRALSNLQRYLRMEGFRVQERVLGAKVPILKLGYGNLDCDLSCNNLLPVFNTRLLKAYADIDPQVVSLTRETKRWAKEQNVHGAPEGHLSSYAFTLMVIFYMQVRGALPCLQGCASENPKWYTERGKTFNVAMDLSSPPPRMPGRRLSFYDLACFFHDEFSWGESVVSIRTGALANLNAYPVLKRPSKHGFSPEEAKEMLHIEDPFDVARNLNCVFAPNYNAKLWFAFEDVVDDPAHFEEKETLRLGAEEISNAGSLQIESIRKGWQ